MIKIFIISIAILFGYTWLNGDYTLTNTLDISKQVLYPLITISIAMMLIFGIDNLNSNRGSHARNILAYALFFSISVTSFFGFTEVMTGSHAGATNPVFYGLSFYSAALAYNVLTRCQANRSIILITSNPLLLFTGPITVKVDRVKAVYWRRRILYYGSFVVIGIFFFKIIAAPLTHFLWMVNITNLFGALAFAVIFELFVYFNFAGLSLLLYGIFGFMGLRIPLNFRQPFSSRNMVEYWRGWHISLSVVLKEIFYKPSRKYVGSTASVLVVFLASALWHGVTVNFLLWGVFHSCVFVITLFFLRINMNGMASILMLCAIVVGRLLFADSDTARLMTKISIDFSVYDYSHFQEIPKSAWISLFFALLLVGSEFIFSKRRFFRERTYKFLRVAPVQFILASLILLLISTSSGMDYAVYGQR